MKRRLCTALLAVFALGSAQAQPVVYRLLPEHSFVHFEVLHFGTSTIRGRFGPLQGEVTLDRRAGRGDVGLRIPTAGVSTGLGFFDARLRQGDLLASAEFPEAFFVASQFRFAGDKLAELRGELTWRGVSQALTLRALRFGCHADLPAAAQSSPGPALGAAVSAAPAAAPAASPDAICGGDFEGELLRSEFGATFGLPFVGDRVRLVVQVEGRRS